MSFPPKDVMDSVSKDSEGKPKMSEVPRETVRNVLINCLANYQVKDRKEIFYVNTTAEAILGAEGDTVELKEKFRKFLIEVVYASTVQVNEKGEQSGVYFSWVISQVLAELGVKEEE